MKFEWHMSGIRESDGRHFIADIIPVYPPMRIVKVYIGEPDDGCLVRVGLRSSAEEARILAEGWAS